MKLPHWVEEDIDGLPANFTGQILLEVWRGGVTRRDIIDRRQAPSSKMADRAEPQTEA